MTKARQKADETQANVARSTAAIKLTKPDPAMRRSPTKTTATFGPKPIHRASSSTAASLPMKPGDVSRRSPSKSNGHCCVETHTSRAVAADAATCTTKPKRMLRRRQSVGGDGVSQRTHEAHCAIADTVAAIQELWRRRQAWHRAEKALTLQAKGLLRRECDGDKSAANTMFDRIAAGDLKPGDEQGAFNIAPHLASIAHFEPLRKDVEKTLKRLAASLPIWQWAKPIWGLDVMGIAGLVGECGDIGSYKSVAALWKRMGVAVIKGERQRKKAGVEALEHGYAPSRRSVLWNISNGLVGGLGHGPRPEVGEDISTREGVTEWQAYFVDRMRAWATNKPEHAREPVERDGKMYESFSSHCANHAKRVTAKRFLAKLYVAWRNEPWDDNHLSGHADRASRTWSAADTDAAIVGAKPNPASRRRTNSKSSQPLVETQMAHAAADAANCTSKPTISTRRRHLNGGAPT